MIAAKRQHRGMHHRAAVKNHDVGGAAADVEQRHAEFALLGKQRRVGRGKRLEHDLERRDVGALAALGQVLAVALRRGDDMDARFQPHPGHPDRIAHALLVVDRELLRQDVQYLAIERNRDRARRVDHALDVARADFAAAHRDDTVAVEPAHVRAGFAYHRRAHAHARGLLGLGRRRRESPRPWPRY